jgi:hypothetical protein
MGTLRREDLAKFDCKFFVNDCNRRFVELDADNTGLLSMENLESSLVDMFPTLQLDLATEEHRIPAMHKSIPNLIATFDTDGDEHWDFEDFVSFVKFQQAWRAQFFLSKRGSEAFSKTDAHKGVRRSSSVQHVEKEPSAPQSQKELQTLGSCKVAEARPSSVSQAERSMVGKSPVKKEKGLAKEGGLRDAHTDFNTAMLSPVKSPARHFRSSRRYAPRKSCMLDASRGAFYSSLASFSTTV